MYDHHDLAPPNRGRLYYPCRTDENFQDGIWVDVEGTPETGSNRRKVEDVTRSAPGKTRFPHPVLVFDHLKECPFFSYFGTHGELFHPLPNRDKTWRASTSEVQNWGTPGGHTFCDTVTTSLFPHPDTEQRGFPTTVPRPKGSQGPYSSHPSPTIEVGTGYETRTSTRQPLLCTRQWNFWSQFITNFIPPLPIIKIQGLH